jgi:hypothetical protein
VASWAQQSGFHYRFIGDELFSVVPEWYMAKVQTKLPVATDYARLIYLQQALGEGFEQVIWLDADVLIFDQALTLEFTGSCAFGQEFWVQEHNGKLVARSNLHNAVCVFKKNCVVLPFLIQTIASLVQRVDPAHLAPQFVGPKLLNALHSLCNFSLLPQVGALSPLVVADICAGSGVALDLLRQQSQVSPLAVNLCASLIGEEAASAVVAFLLTKGSL